ncbi:MAG: TlyA family RNA methyltransferase [Pseudomonadota bacterium]
MADAADPVRLDVALVERGLVATRSRARDLIKRGVVRLGGSVVTKPGASVPPTSEIALDPDEPDSVSRGALKLQAALDHFALDATGRLALDIGASTGGFTEALLRAGANHVVAVDIGTGQLHSRLRSDPRVTSLEQTDARALVDTHLPSCPGAIVADVSFISLTDALGAPLRLAAPGAWCVLLVKPQFELSRRDIGKGGIVRLPADQMRALKRVKGWLTGLETESGHPVWRILGAIPSPITGKKGNTEYLLAAVHVA